MQYRRTLVPSGYLSNLEVPLQIAARLQSSVGMCPIEIIILTAVPSREERRLPAVLALHMARQVRLARLLEDAGVPRQAIYHDDIVFRGYVEARTGSQASCLWRLWVCREFPLVLLLQARQVYIFLGMPPAAPNPSIKRTSQAGCASFRPPLMSNVRPHKSNAQLSRKALNDSHLRLRASLHHSQCIAHNAWRVSLHELQPQNRKRVRDFSLLREIGCRFSGW